MKHELQIRNIECHAYHGCMEEEAKIGQRFTVDVDLCFDMTAAIENDSLSDAADYVVIHKIVREEMGIRSKLIEHAAGRIVKRMQQQYPMLTALSVSIHKYNPPVNGQLGCATVVVSL